MCAPRLSLQFPILLTHLHLWSLTAHTTAFSAPPLFVSPFICALLTFSIGSIFYKSPKKQLESWFLSHTIMFSKSRWAVCGGCSFGAYSNNQNRLVCFHTKPVNLQLLTYNLETRAKAYSISQVTSHSLHLQEEGLYSIQGLKEEQQKSTKQNIILSWNY